jgi:moderate conductance mechanosensitive channel
MDFKIFEKFSEKLNSLPEAITVSIEIIGIIVVSMLIVKIGSFIIKKAFLKQEAIRFGFENKKVKTMVTLLVSVYKYTIYIIAFVIILTDIFKLRSVLATAGIGGIALGLGAQSLIKDIISGFFIVMEDQYSIGDLISIDNLMGTVEKLELRVTRLRNANGDQHIIPNGDIKRVTNHTRGNKAIIVDIPISYKTDINKALEIIGRVCSMVKDEISTITEDPIVLGVTELSKDVLNIRVMGKALPNEQGTVERRIRLLIKEEFDKENLTF